MAFMSASFNDKESMSAISAAPQQTNVVSSTEYYVKMPKNKKRFHALKFTVPNFKFESNVKTEMARDATNQYVPKYDWEAMPKQGQGSEFNRENREIAKRRKHGYMPKKISPDDMPWIVTVKGNEKEKDKAKDKHYIGKKSITENSCFYVFVKCADGGFEAHPVEDWYLFTAHKAYKTLNIEEAEEEFKRRHKILNKYLIMANKRKNEGEDGEDGEEEEHKTAGKAGLKLNKLDIRSDDEMSDDDRRKKKSYKSSNLSDDDDDDDDAADGAKKDDDDGSDSGKKGAKSGKKVAKKAKKPAKSGRGKRRASDDDDDDEMKNREDSDDGDAEGLEKDYSSTSSESSFESEEERNEEEKYEEKGIDEEEPIKALDKSTDEEEESEEDEGLTEEGKEYRKLMSKDGSALSSAANKEPDAKEQENNFDEFIRTGKLNDANNDEDSKDSNLTSDSDLDDDVVERKAKTTRESSKLKRKATEDLAQSKLLKKQNKNSASAPNMAVGVNQDESSSSSTMSANNNGKSSATPMNKSLKTAAALAAASKSHLTQSASVANTSAAAASASSNNPISESEVRKYLERRPMTTRELYQKFRSKTQETLSKDDLLKYLTAVLNKLDTNIVVKNNEKYLELKNK